MTLPDFLEVFGRIRPGTVIRINGYRSSDGSVKNHAVEVLEPGVGYRNLVKASQAELLRMKQSFVAPDDAKACAKLLASYEKTLTGAGGARTSNEELSQVHGTLLFRPANNMTTFVLLGARAVRPALVVTESEKTKRASTRERDPVVVAAEKISKLLPLDQFIGRFNLVPTDLDSVEIVAP